MKKDIFDNKANPFTVPDGYFDTLQERIMNRIKTETNNGIMDIAVHNPHASSPFTVGASFLSLHARKLVAAACILLLFSGYIYIMYSGKQTFVAETAVDEDFYQLFYTSDRTTLLAESLDITMPADISVKEIDYTEKDEAIIRFLERDNINLVAILSSETFITP
jgi:hypothetical protein